MTPEAVLRDNLADITSFGLLAVGLLILGFVALDVVTPGSLRTKIWIEHSRSGVILAVAESLGLAVAVAAGISASTDFVLWRGLLFTLVYGVVTIALMMFSFVLIDWLTPGKLGEQLLDDADGRSPAAWVNAVVFVVIGLAVGAVLTL